jgi:hypothetical protein
MYNYWDYFLTIEDDLLATSRYVEFVSTNFQCYSLEYARLIMTAGAELDMVFKQLCNKISATHRAESIGDYYDIIIPTFPDILTKERYVKGCGIVLKPFDGWTKGFNPAWWSDGYNKIKHERNTNFDKATLKNTLDIVAALSIILYKYYKLEYGPILDFGIREIQKLIVPHNSKDPEGDGFTYSVNMDK